MIFLNICLLRETRKMHLSSFRDLNKTYRGTTTIDFNVYNIKIICNLIIFSCFQLGVKDRDLTVGFDIIDLATRYS